MAKDNKTDKTAGTQLLDRTVAIMKLLGDAGQAGLRPIEVSKQLGLTTTTAHRIMTALERHGLVEREQATHRYRLGLSLFAMERKRLMERACVASAGQPSCGSRLRPGTPSS